MTRRAGLTEQDVFDAASQLEAMGKQVTALKVLAMLGGGSLTTIYRYLEDWESTRKEQSLSAGSDEMPQAVMNAFKNAWKIAVDTAEERSSATATITGSRVGGAIADQLQRQVEAHREEIERLTKALSSTRSERDNAVQRLALLESEVAKLKLSNDKLSRSRKKGGKKK